MTAIEEIAGRLVRAGYRVSERIKSGRSTFVATHPRHPKPVPLATAIAEVLEDAVGEQMMKERG